MVWERGSWRLSGWWWWKRQIVMDIGEYLVNKRYGGRLRRKCSKVNSFEAGHGGNDLVNRISGGKLNIVGWLLRCYVGAVHKHRKWLPWSGLWVKSARISTMLDKESIWLDFLQDLIMFIKTTMDILQDLGSCLRCHENDSEGWGFSDVPQLDAV